MNSDAPFAIVLICAPFFFACSKSSPELDSFDSEFVDPIVNPSVGTDLRVTTQDGSSFTGYPATIVVAWGTTEPSSLQISLGISAQSPSGERWSADTMLTESDFQSGSVVAQVGMLPDAPGHGHASRWVAANDRTFATSGTLTISLSGPSTLTATLTGADASLAANVNGSYQVRCLVPASALGKVSNGLGDDGQEELLFDKNFTTSLCTPFRKLVYRGSLLLRGVTINCNVPDQRSRDTVTEMRRLSVFALPLPTQQVEDAWAWSYRRRERRAQQQANTASQSQVPL